MPRPATHKPRIEAAAVRLFADEGILGTTIRRIAEEAGVTEGALYRHYAGKEEMAWRLYCRELRGVLERIEPALTSTKRSLAGRVGDVVGALYRDYRDRPERLAFILSAAESFPHRRLVDEGVDPDAPLLRVLCRELGDGGDDGDLTLLLAIVRGIVLEPVRLHFHGTLTDWPDECTDRVAGAVAAAIRATTRPSP